MGPFIFIIFMKDIVKKVRLLNIVQFADYKFLFLTDSDPVRVVHRTKTAVSDQEEWFERNHLTPN